MKTLHPSLLTALTMIITSSATMHAEVQSDANVSTETLRQTQASAQTIQPFTGKVLKNKVRVRLQPSFEGPVLGELNKGDFVLTLGEVEDFYAIQPPEDARGYIFRTFVLDNVVEGNKVNVRLKPDLDAPIVAQLNSGDRIEGVISTANNKWLEIKLPNTARYYVSKDYIEKVGDAKMMGRQAQRKSDVYQLLHNTEVVSRNEMQKPFEQINLDAIKTNYTHIILDFPDFPDASAKAKTLLSALENEYAAKKMSYLETKATKVSSDLEQQNRKLSDELSSHKQKLQTLEQQLQDQQSMVLNSSSKIVDRLPVNMAEWLPKEEALFNAWAEENGNTRTRDYYEDQNKKSILVKGIIEAYNRPVKNKPGDFVLINPATKLPIAFLYSTQINLQDLIGHESTLRVTPRPNNNYAFPAYFVLSIE
jgi:uncharacterized protein YgiM (DUF1202 family)